MLLQNLGIQTHILSRTLTNRKELSPLMKLCLIIIIIMKLNPTEASKIKTSVCRCARYPKILC